MADRPNLSVSFLLNCYTHFIVILH